MDNESGEFVGGHEEPGERRGREIGTRLSERNRKLISETR